MYPRILECVFVTRHCIGDHREIQDESDRRDEVEGEMEAPEVWFGRAMLPDGSQQDLDNCRRN